MTSMQLINILYLDGFLCLVPGVVLINSINKYTTTVFNGYNKIQAK